MSERFDVIVAGGGPAGSSAAITAARDGARVLLLERGGLPRHKVCGEFVSPESLNILRGLLGSEDALQAAPRIERARVVFARDVLEAPVRPPALSVSRYQLDALLWDAAARAGADARQQVEVQRVAPDGRRFRVAASAGEFSATAVINASGRWSRVSGVSARSSKARLLGLKAHFRAPNIADFAGTTTLYVFRGGYCGVQPVLSPDGIGVLLNACALVDASAAASLAQALALHPALAAAARDWQPVMGPVTTSPLLFGTPRPVDENGVLLAGDAAGFIDPFVGDGIAIALASGALAGGCCIEGGAERYAREYRRRFAPAFRNARRLRRLLEMPPPLRAPVVKALRLPGVAEAMLRRTRARL